MATNDYKWIIWYYLFPKLPHHASFRLRRGEQVDAENYETVTVMFSDIADFQEISASSAPMQIVAFLNELYNFMDSRIEKFDVYKVSYKQSFELMAMTSG